MDIKGIDSRLDSLKKKLETVKNIRPSDIIFVKKDKKVLSKEEFNSDDFMRGYVKCDTPDDINTGDFIRYKTWKKGEPVRYLWGGVVIYKDPERRYMRVKNPYTNRVWSVQLLNQGCTHVFYVRKKLDDHMHGAYDLDPDGVYTNLNTASTEGLIAKVIERGDEDVILSTAKMIQENNRKTYFLP
jgi:hypothetical protein